MAALGIGHDDEATLGTELDPLTAENTFNALDEIPVYPPVLAVRDDIISAIETACSYDQLNFLVGPAQTELIE